MDETKSERFENFINRHKVAITATITVVATTAACIGMSRLATNGMRTFLESKDLWTEYITQIDE